MWTRWVAFQFRNGGDLYISPICGSFVLLEGNNIIPTLPKTVPIESVQFKTFDRCSIDPETPVGFFYWGLLIRFTILANRSTIIERWWRYFYYLILFKIKDCRLETVLIHRKIWHAIKILLSNLRIPAIQSLDENRGIGWGTEFECQCSWEQHAYITGVSCFLSLGLAP